MELFHCNSSDKIIEKVVLICGVAINEEIVKGWQRCKQLQFIVKKRDHYQQRGPNNSGIASHDEGKDLCVARRGMMKMSANRGSTSFSS